MRKLKFIGVKYGHLGNIIIKQYIQDLKPSNQAPEPIPLNHDASSSLRMKKGAHTKPDKLRGGLINSRD